LPKGEADVEAVLERGERHALVGGLDEGFADVATKSVSDSKGLSCTGPITKDLRARIGEKRRNRARWRYGRVGPGPHRWHAFRA
jgi:hypothetical protein